jgi:hypothetical protein
MVCQMNKIILIVVFVSFAHGVSGQTFNEWFRQKNTQRKYLVQQIAALKVYLNYLKEGYDIAKKGLNIVGNIKQGKFDLDMEYLESLHNVNSAIGGSVRVANVVAYQRAILIEFRKLINIAEASDFLSHEEREYISAVYSNVLSESELSLEELDRILSNSDFEMKDDERIKRIDLLYVDMKDKYFFTKSFSNSTRLLITQRSKDQQDILFQQDLILK